MDEDDAAGMAETDADPATSDGSPGSDIFTGGIFVKN